MMYRRKLNKAFFSIVVLIIMIGLTASSSFAAALWDWGNTSNLNLFYNPIFSPVIGFGINTNTTLSPQQTITELVNGSATNGQIATTSTTEFTTTADDRAAVELTVYSNNLGLVKDIREIQLSIGQGELMFVDVPLGINPASVIVKSQNYPNDFTILEQTFKDNLITSEKLLDDYVGKTIKLVDFNMYHNTKNVVEATLLSTPRIYQEYIDPYYSYIPYPSFDYGQIYKVDGEIYLGHPGYTVLPEMPEDFIDKPILLWSYDNGVEDAHNLEVSYITSNLNWRADYILIVNNEETLADLSSWVTVDNQSGATYKNAHLILVAGNIQQVSEQGYYPYGVVPTSGMYGGLYGAAIGYGADYAQFEEEAFFEYHTYDLERTTTIKDKESKQISMIKAPGIDIEKEFLIEDDSVYYLKSYYEDDQPNLPVNIYIKFENSEDTNLGIPLPAGIMRLFKEDDNNSLYFIGEDYISHTPIDEEVRAKVGEAFDILAERIQKDFQQIDKNVYESEWEITLRNHKNEDVTIGVKEEFTDDWEIIDNTHPYEKIDAFTIKFDIDVQPDEEVVLTYKVRVTEPVKEPEYIVYIPQGYTSPVQQGYGSSTGPIPAEDLSGAPIEALPVPEY